MPNWIDILSLIVTVTVLGAAVYGGLYLLKQINEGVASTKESLKNKGLEISGSGVSVKTNKRFDRQDYVDATQRGIVRAIGASSFRKGGASTDSTPVSTPVLQRTDSTGSTKSTKSSQEKKKKLSLFGSKKKE